MHCTAGPGTDQGQYEATIRWFQRGPAERTPPSWGSAHVVFDWDGSRACICVPVTARAFHASAPGGWNDEWLAIEWPRALPIDRPGVPYHDRLYRATARLIANWAQTFGFSPAAIRTHQEIQPWDRTDPGPQFDRDRLVRLAVEAAR